MEYLRVKKQADFQKLFSKGRRAFSPSLTMICSLSADAHGHLGGKKARQERAAQSDQAAASRSFPRGAQGDEGDVDNRARSQSQGRIRAFHLQKTFEMFDKKGKTVSVHFSRSQGKREIFEKKGFQALSQNALHAADPLLSETSVEAYLSLSSYLLAVHAGVHQQPRALFSGYSWARGGY